MCTTPQLVGALSMAPRRGCCSQQGAGAKHGLSRGAKIRAFTNIGSEPAMMLTGPVDVTENTVRTFGHEEDRTSICSN